MRIVLLQEKSCRGSILNIKMEIFKTKDEIRMVETKEQVFLIKDLNLELEKIEKQIKETEKEPDEILVSNFDKFAILEDLKKRKDELNNLLK